MRQAFDVFGEGDDVLEVGVLAVVVDWVVDYYAVYGGVGVGRDYCFFDVVFVDGGEGVFEATVLGLVSAGVYG